MAEDQAEERLIECPTHGMLPESAFYKGNHSHCRECVKKSYRDWYAANKDHRRASIKAWRQQQKRFIEAGKRALGE